MTVGLHDLTLLDRLFVPDDTYYTLDGVVDSDAGRATRDGRLSELMARRGIKYLADWRFNVENFVRQSQEERIHPANLRIIGAVQPQGTDQFLVIEIMWK